MPDEGGGGDDRGDDCRLLSRCPAEEGVPRPSMLLAIDAAPLACRLLLPASRRFDVVLWAYVDVAYGCRSRLNMDGA